MKRSLLCRAGGLSAMLLAFTAAGPFAVAQPSEPGRSGELVSPELIYQPTARPDRIVLTWNDDPTTTQAVSWRTSADVTASLAQITVARPDPDLEEASRQVAGTWQELETDLSVARFHTVKFTRLEPATKYAYRVGDGVNWSEWFHFRTASADPEPFSFIYFGDAQNDIRSRWSRVIREAYGDAPHAAFLLHAGDLVNRAEADGEWGDWCNAGAWLNAMVPSVAVPGNHEMAKQGDGTRTLSHHWRPQFAFPEHGPEGLEETCYTLVYQNLRIIGMNSNQMQREQTEWLDGVLEDNTCPWVVCTFHHPMFSTGKDRDNSELRAVWKPVLDKHHVDLVLQGHDHTYGRTGLDTPVATANLATGVNKHDLYSGTVYVVSVSGPKMYSLQRHPFMPRQAENTQLYQIVHVDGDKLHYEAFTATGELYDAFTLQKQDGGINRMTEYVPDAPERLGPPTES